MKPLALALLLLIATVLMAQSNNTAERPTQPAAPSSVPSGASELPAGSALPALPTLAAPGVTPQTTAVPARQSNQAPNAQEPGAAIPNESPAPVAPLPESDAKSQSTPTAGSASGFSSRTPRYILRPGDVLDVTFSFAPEFNQTLPVQPDGFVTLKNVGDVHVAGLNVTEMRAELIKKYSRILHNPQVDVALKDFEKPFFIASGQLVKPGKYEMRGDTTVTEALAIAGGFNEKAKHSQVIVFHHVSPELLQTRTVNVKAILAGKRVEDIRLQPGDMVWVPQTRMSKIKPYLPTASLGTYMNAAPF